MPSVRQLVQRGVDTAGSAVDAVRVLTVSRLLTTPHRPDRLGLAGLGVARWGITLAAGYAANAALYPHEPAIIDDDGVLSFQEVDRRTSAAAGALLRRGLTQDDTVGLLARNHRGFVEAAVALAKVGADVLYLNTGFAGPQLADVLAREGASGLVYDAEFGPLLADTASTRAGRLRVVLDGDAGEGEVSYAELLCARSASPPRPREPGRHVILTSGTTGAPKGAARSSAGLDAAVSLLSRIPLRARGRTLIAAPLFHTWGFAHLSLAQLLGSTVVLTRRFDPAATVGLLERHRVDALAAVPVMLQRLVDLPAEVRDRHDTSALRVVAVSGSALSPQLAAGFMAAYGDVVFNLYGSTEAAYVAIATPADMRAAPGCVGRPPRGTVVRLVDDEGREVPTGQVGQIMVGNSMVFGGYTSGEDKDRLDGLVATGDLGRFDDAGRLFVEGRADDMIVSGGENVFPGEVEETLAEHEGVAEVVVVGVEDADFGQRLAAFVVRRPGATVTAEELTGHVRDRLARFKVPKTVTFLEELPRNSTGKVVKRNLPD